MPRVEINTLSTILGAFVRPKPVEDRRQTKTAPTLFERLRKRDKRSFAECINQHGGFVWNLAKAYTTSEEEAGNATAEIFNEIWKYSACDAKFEMDEHQTISYIARRYLFTRRSFVRQCFVRE